MPSVPLPFLVAVLLVAFLARAAWSADPRPPVSFLALLAVCALQSVLIGLRWGYGVAAASWLAPLVAATIPPLTFVSFSGLAGPSQLGRTIWLHAIPAMLVILLLALARDAVDAALIILYLGYAGALVRLAWPGPDNLGVAKLESAVPTHRALLLAAAVLAASAAVDLAIAFDLGHGGGLAAPIAGTANLFSLLLLGVAGVVGGRALPAPEPLQVAQTDIADAPEALSEAEAAQIAARIDALMAGQGLYRDADLNLRRLARRAGIPARRLSAAINRQHRQNVSQYINGHRIAAACRLLAAGDAAVTQVMFEAGFQTKSNFNREFRRVTGTNPVAWRAARKSETTRK